MLQRKKILVIRFSSIGDIVLTTPVVRALKNQGDYIVHYLTKKSNIPVLSANPYIDKIYAIDQKVAEVMEDLRKEKYDFIVDLHKNIRSYQTKTGLRVPSASFSKLNTEKWLLVNFGVNRLPDIHIVDRYFMAVKPLGIVNDGLGLDYFIDATEQVMPEEIPQDCRHGYIALVIGGKHRTKIFPEDKVISVCKKLDYPVILLGGKEDRAAGERICSGAGSLVFNACGLYTINRSAFLVKQSLAVLTNDTGLMHIAAAFRKPIASIWGNTVPAFGMYPYYPENENPGSLIAEVKGLSCRPCSKIGYDRCPKKHFRCMQDINEEDIVNFLRRFIR